MYLKLAVLLIRKEQGSPIHRTERNGCPHSGQAWLLTSISSLEKNTLYLRLDLKYDVSYDRFTISDSLRTFLSYSLV